MSLVTQIANDVDDGVVISNQAFLTAQGIGRIPTDNPETPEVDDSTEIVVQSQPALTLEKSVVDDNGGAFVPGDPVSYTLVLRNEGAGPAVDVVVEDVVPEGIVGALVVEGQLQDGVARWSIDRIETGKKSVSSSGGRLTGVSEWGRSRKSLWHEGKCRASGKSVSFCD